MSVHEREIDADRLATSELCLEALLRLLVLGKDDETGGVLVDAMDNERTTLTVRSVPVLDQLVHRRNIRIPLERNRHGPIIVPCRLGDALHQLRPALKPVHDWLRGFERTWNTRLYRLDDVLAELQSQEKAP